MFVLYCSPYAAKGNRVNIPEPGIGDCRCLRVVKCGNASELGDVAGALGRVVFSS